MNPRIVISLCGICLFALSCRPDKAKKEAESKTREFFLTLKNEDGKGLARLYPGFSKLEQYYKSDSGKIISTTEANGIITVTVDNRFTNNFGKLSQEINCLYFKADSIGRAILYDSKGLSDFNDNDDFIFGSKTGCIDDRTDTTDQQIIKKLKRAKQLMLDRAVSVYLELKTNIRLISWSWESGFGGSASGRGIVRNGSTYSIPKLKYKVTYKDQFGSPITSDDGYVTFDALDAGESKSFIFYTSYVGGASRATIELLFDDDMIFKYLSKKDWTGNECEEYFRNHPDMVMGR
jgi:hypothetical protein